MAKIVSVVVVDMTRPVEQAGFKSVALFDFTQEKETTVVTDTKSLSASDLMTLLQNILVMAVALLSFLVNQ